MVEFLSSDEFQNRQREELLKYADYFEESEDLASTYLRSQRNLLDIAWLSAKDDGQKLLAASAGARYSVELRIDGLAEHIAVMKRIEKVPYSKPKK